MAQKEPEEQLAPAGGSKKLIIIIAVVVVVLVLAGVGAFLALKSGKGAGEEEEAAEEEQAEETEEGAPENAVLPLDAFIVNLQVKGSFLKTTMQLEFAEPQLPPTMENDVPKVRDAIINILSAKASSDLLTPEGKEKLREEIRNKINEVLGAEDVTGVYFTEFIIQ